MTSTLNVSLEPTTPAQTLPQGSPLSPMSNWNREVTKESRQDWLQRLPSRCEEALRRLKKSTDIDDVLFDLLADGKDKVPVHRFWSAIECTGIQASDPRLEETRTAFAMEQRRQGISTQSYYRGFEVDRETFIRCIQSNIFMTGEIFKNDLIVPEFKAFVDNIQEVFEKCRSNTSGRPSNLIPQLARLDPELYAAAICTVDGQRHSFGDSDWRFSLQACSKPFNYAIAASAPGGPQYVHKFVGQEPSGRGGSALNLDHNGKPHNPMITTGGIVTTALIKQEEMIADRFDYVASRYKKLCGGEYVGFNNACYLSMREAGDRDHALSHYMRENKCFPDNNNFDINKAIQFYFQVKCIDVTVESAAVMAATLANGGICPTTGERVLSGEAVRDTMSLMYSCGMYDYSGQFAFKVGLPAKSGCSGAIILVVPNLMGLCVWSPPVDENGNCCRGIQLCEELVQRFNFHNYDNMKHTVRKMDPRRREEKADDNVIVALLFGAATGDINIIRRFALLKMDMGTADYDGRTALHLAAAEGQLAAVRTLVEQCNVPVTPKDRWSFTPLDDARKFGRADVIKYLEKAQKERNL